MGTSDWIALGAGVLSFWSLYIARQAAQQTIRAQGVEKRMELLLIVVSIGVRITECERMIAGIRKSAASVHAPELDAAVADVDRSVKEALASFEFAKRTFDALKPEESLDAYSKARHRLEDAKNDIEGVYQALKEAAPTFKRLARTGGNAGGN